MSLFSTYVSSTCFGPHRSIISSVLYKLYSQTLVCAVTQSRFVWVIGNSCILLDCITLQDDTRSIQYQVHCYVRTWPATVCTEPDDCSPQPRRPFLQDTWTPSAHLPMISSHFSPLRTLRPKLFVFLIFLTLYTSCSWNIYRFRIWM